MELAPAMTMSEFRGIDNDGLDKACAFREQRGSKSRLRREIYKPLCRELFPVPIDGFEIRRSDGKGFD